MTSTNIVFMIHMRNKYYEKLNKIKEDLDKQDKIKYDKIKQDKIKVGLDEEDLDKEYQDKENLENCKEIFKNYLNYLEKVSIKTFESMELQFI